MTKTTKRPYGDPTSKRPYGDPTSKRRSVTINEQDWQKLKALGNGNASAGIREAVRLYFEAGYLNP